MAFSITPLHSLRQGDQNEVKHYFIGHVTHLFPVSASCDAVVDVI